MNKIVEFIIPLLTVTRIITTTTTTTKQIIDSDEPYRLEGDKRSEHSDSDYEREEQKYVAEEKEVDEQQQQQQQQYQQPEVEEVQQELEGKICSKIKYMQKPGRKKEKFMQANNCIVES